MRVSVKGDRFRQGLTIEEGLEARRSVEQLRELGWELPAALDDQRQVMAFEFEAGDEMQYWIGLENLYAITRYNRSVMYAMVVHQLADLLREAKQQ